MAPKTSKIRLLHFGLGAIGRQIALKIQNIARLESVSVVDIDPRLIGQNFFEVIQVPKSFLSRKKKSPLRVESQLHRRRAQVALHSTRSWLEDIEPELRDLLKAGLREHVNDTCVWSDPVGGLFMWVRLPADIDMQKLTARANEAGFFFAAGSAFHVDYANKPYIRLAFGHVPDELITEGIPVLAKAINESRTSNASRRFTALFDDESE